ncbi:hypothetical protein [uncultured Gammaproteobacteria bacterium]|jgi:hypothetical protein|nr:hypothetical protein [uncultured Gammaproteobacteria bacterium]CAC9559409.1 hypothetical protein [uncultured Gammaproteobacteria bacterium]CAC9564076.1 hypothetical protein [uncultured Gammaproteobacteria bacterium]CAC9569053.1 hypothetical protein [uncultured Gammaproteobacteria bacterium]
MKFLIISLFFILNSQLLLAYTKTVSDATSNKTINMANYKIEGVHLKVWNIVYKNFINNNYIPKNKKNLRYYSIKISENENQYIVYFGPIISEFILNNKVTKGGGTERTKSIEYWINKKTMSITKYIFFK